jgi:hypothetical protein
VFSPKIGEIGFDEQVNIPLKPEPTIGGVKVSEGALEPEDLYSVPELFCFSETRRRIHGML